MAFDVLYSDVIICMEPGPMKNGKNGGDSVRNCKVDSEIMRNVDWLTRYEGRCYFYPGRDCPGWETGGVCGRIGEVIPGNRDKGDV